MEKNKKILKALQAIKNATETLDNLNKTLNELEKSLDEQSLNDSSVFKAFENFENKFSSLKKRKNKKFGFTFACRI